MDTIELLKKIKNEDYVVIRNWDDLDKLGDEDIDILCKNKKRIIKVLHLKKRHRFNNGVNYVFHGNDTTVKIDLWGGSSGYFCKKWADNILQNRVFNSRYQCFIPCEEDAKFTLLYHVIFQKKEIPRKYESVFTDEFGAEFAYMEDKRAFLLKHLNAYLTQNGYCYSYNSYPYAVINLNGIDKVMIKNDIGRIIKRKICIVLLKLYITIGGKNGRKN